MFRNDVFDLINTEREHQTAKWAGNHRWGSGDCSSVFVDKRTKLAVLIEEVGEVARAVLEDQPTQLHDELVQVAAVAVAWLEGSLNQ